MAGLSQIIPNLRLGFQPHTSSTRSTRTAAAAIPAFSRWSFNTHTSSSPLPRFSYGANFLLKKNTFHAPNSGHLPAEKSIRGKATDSNSGTNETEKTPQGPPFLTIVAGAIVFFLVCWVIGSLVIWLVSPVVNLFISK